MRNQSLLLLILSFLLFSLFSGNGWATTYYVKNGGSDGAAGTSDATAWATISKVNSSSFSPGDQILFKRGSTWNENLTPPSSGTSGNPIFFGAYDAGAKPIINGGNPAVTISNKTGITLNNLNIRHASVISGYPYTVSISTSNYVIVEYCDVGWNNYWGHGIVSYFSDDGIIRYNTVDSGDRVIHTSEVGYGNGIYIKDGSDRWDIHHNTVIDWSHDGISIYGDASPSEGNSPVTDVLIHHNDVSAPDIDTGRGFSAQGYQGLSGYPGHVNKIYDNYFHHGHSRIQVNMEGVEFYYNIIHNTYETTFEAGPNGQGVAIENYTNPALGKGNHPQNMKFYNNTFVNNAGNAILIIAYGEAGSSDITNNIISNNIFYNNGGGDDTWPNYQLNIRSSSQIYGNTFKNNIAYKSGITPVVSYYGSNLSVSQFNSQNGNRSNTISGNIQGDPLFVSSADFHLQAGSPAINAGINVGLTSDYAGNPIIGNPDIGAYEYTSLPTAPTPPAPAPQKIPSSPSDIIISP
ncbi:MAG: hypothetical protein A2W25_09345 [candidate division Zixibacteria bacterium RBG_16_53_22]|nr:MAG: hypothetical protein A2W25_09345 [candidate division Zixibacteria bacterium RBG_16_53_22]